MVVAGENSLQLPEGGCIEDGGYMRMVQVAGTVVCGCGGQGQEQPLEIAARESEVGDEEQFPHCEGEALKSLSLDDPKSRSDKTHGLDRDDPIFITGLDWT